MAGLERRGVNCQTGQFFMLGKKSIGVQRAIFSSAPLTSSSIQHQRRSNLLNENPGLLKVGDKVVTEYDIEDGTVIRTVLSVEVDKLYFSGYCITVDGGVPCPYCGRQPARRITADGQWFVPIEGDKW